MKTLRNFVQLIGNLGQDVELREYESGSKKATFSLATNEYYKDNKGETVEKTEWHNIVAWGKTAELMTDYLGKGDRVIIQGKITNRKYEDSTGKTRFITEIVAGDFIKLSKN